MFYTKDNSSFVTLLRGEKLRVYEFDDDVQVCVSLVCEFSLEELIQMDAPLYLEDRDEIYFIKGNSRRIYLENLNEACILHRKITETLPSRRNRPEKQCQQHPDQASSLS